MTAFIEDYRNDCFTGVDAAAELSIPAWLAQGGVEPGATSGSARAVGDVRRGRRSDRTRFRPRGRTRSVRPEGENGRSRRPNTRGTMVTSAPAAHISNIGTGAQGGHRILGPVQGVRRNAASVAVVAGVGAVFGLMLHFSGLGAPEQEPSHAVSYVGVVDTVQR